MMMARMWGGGVSLMVGATIGLVFAALLPLLIEFVRVAYDESHPVWTEVKVTSIERDDNSVTVGLYGNRARKGCRFLRINGLSVRKDGNVLFASITRVDAPMYGATREEGPQEIGTFRVVPVWPDAVEVRITAEHDCGGRHMVTRLASVML